MVLTFPRLAIAGLTLMSTFAACANEPTPAVGSAPNPRRPSAASMLLNWVTASLATLPKARRPCLVVWR